MPEQLYRPLLRGALTAVIRHPFLWVLGFIAAFLGTGGEYEFLLNLYRSTSETGLGADLGIASLLGVVSENALSGLSSIVGFFSVQGALVLLVLLVIAAIMIAIVVSAQGGLVWAAARVIEDERETFFTSFTQGFSQLWSLFFIIVVTRFLAFFVFSVVGLPLLAVLMQIDALSATQSVLLVLYVVGAPLFILFSLIGKYATAFRMVEGRGTLESVSRGMRLFAENWLVSVEMALVLFVAVVASGVAFVLAMLFVAIPFVIAGLVLGSVSAIGLQAVVVLGVAVVLFALLVFGSVLTAFQLTAWTALFLKIRSGAHLSKLMRSIASLAGRG